MTAPAVPTVRIVKPHQLPPVKLRMESAPTEADAQKWANQLGRDVYYIPTNHCAYATFPGAEAEVTK